MPYPRSVTPTIQGMSSSSLLRWPLYSHVPLLRFRYRAFLSREQVDELVRPSSDTVELINAWLVHHGIRSSSISMTHRGNWLTITDVHVSQASQLLGASYQLYRNVITNETVIRTVGYSLPAVLYTHVQTVTPTTYFSSMGVTLQTPHRRPFGPAPAQAQESEKLGMVQARQPPPEPAIVNPSDLRWLYGTVEYVPIAYNPGQNSLAVVGSEPPSLHDLTMFMNDNRRTTNGEQATFIMVNVGGGPLPLNGLPDETSNVAVQYASAMAYPTPLTFYRTLQTEEAFMDLIELFLILPIVPRTISISFNYFLEHDLPPPSARYICNLFEQFGARGSSVLVASGNNGVGAAGNCRTFDVEFPSSCRCDVYHPFQVLHHCEYKSLTRPCFQVPGSPALAELKACAPRSRRPTLEAAFHACFDAPTTRTVMCSHTSSSSKGNMTAFTSTLLAMT